MFWWKLKGKIYKIPLNHMHKTINYNKLVALQSQLNADDHPGHERPEQVIRGKINLY